MSDRSIYCTGCKRYLGIIRDAKLHKDIKYLCGVCEVKRIASDMANNIDDNTSRWDKDCSCNDMFRDLLRKR